MATFQTRSTVYQPLVDAVIGYMAFHEKHGATDDLYIGLNRLHDAIQPHLPPPKLSEELCSAIEVVIFKLSQPELDAFREVEKRVEEMEASE